ncbi:MAG: BrnT family toxin [Blastomonas sp.]|nr:BrnT family toxin [Blastomonas sp.]
MQFEFDPAKSALNKEKHGIDFVEAQALWLDDGRVEFDARSLAEIRLGLVGRIDGKHWTVFFTLRADRIRIFSARRARVTEVARYEREMGLGRRTGPDVR